MKKDFKMKTTSTLMVITWRWIYSTLLCTVKLCQLNLLKLIQLLDNIRKSSANQMHGNFQGALFFAIIIILKVLIDFTKNQKVIRGNVGSLLKMKKFTDFYGAQMGGS